MRGIIERVVLLLVLVATEAAGQGGPALTGLVEDQTGAVVSKVRIVLVNRSSGQVRETVSDQAGRFSFKELQPGDYSLLGHAEDFQSDEQAVTLGDGPVEAKIRMRVALDQEVTVTASGRQLLDPAENADGVRFDEWAFRPLPADADNILAVVSKFLAPAAAGVEGASIVIDGVETDVFDLPAWALKNVLLNSNPYSAEFRRPGKARIEVVTKKGSHHRWRGNFAVFGRDSALDARNFFAQDKPHQNRELYEGGLSGPAGFSHGAFFLNGSRLTNAGTATVNAQMLGTPLIENVPTRREKANLFGRLDLRLNDAGILTVVSALTDETKTGYGVGGFSLPEHRTDSRVRTYRVQISHQANLGDTFFNTLQLNTRRDAAHEGGLALSPSIAVSGAFTAGPNPTFWRNSEMSAELQDIAVYKLGSQTLHFGATFRPKFTDSFDSTNFGGTFRFSSLGAYSAGTPFVFEISRGQPDVSFWDYQASAYVQGEFRPQDALSVVAGLRYDWHSFIDDRENFGPRLALAFAPGDQLTVVRGGGGVFYDRLPASAWRRALLFGGDRILKIVVPSPSFPDPFGDGAGSVPPSLVRIAPDIRTPYTVAAGVAVERALRQGTWITTGFDYLRGARLFRSRDINAPLPSIGLRPNADFLNIAQVESTASMRSRAMTVSLRTLVRRFQANVQYRLLRTIDDTSGIFAPPADNYNLAAERGPADSQRRHQVNFAGTLSFPRAFKVGAVLDVGSSLPYDITTGTDDNHDSVAKDRPAGVTRNTGHGPALLQLDLRVGRLFHVPSPVERERATRNLEINVDAFNVLNRVNFVNFIGVRTSPFFGRANSAEPGRTLQLSVRYHF